MAVHSFLWPLRFSIALNNFLYDWFGFLPLGDFPGRTCVLIAFELETYP